MPDTNKTTSQSTSSFIKLKRCLYNYVAHRSGVSRWCISKIQKLSPRLLNSRFQKPQFLWAYCNHLLAISYFKTGQLNRAYKHHLQAYQCAPYRNLYAIRFAQFLNRIGHPVSAFSILIDAQRWGVKTTQAFTAAFEAACLQLGKHQTKPIKSSRHLALCAQTSPEDKQFLESIQEDQAAFTNFISGHKQSISVVGNSPSPLGKNQGTVIDNNDIVIRFNNYKLGTSYTEDLGSKTTIWARSPGLFVKDRINENFSFILMSAPISVIHTGFDHWDKVRSYKQHGHRICFIPDDVWFPLVDQLNAIPSAGLAVLSLLHKFGASLRADQVHGFSSTNQQSDNFHYFERAKPSLAHNWKKERSILNNQLKS